MKLKHCAICMAAIAVVSYTVVKAVNLNSTSNNSLDEQLYGQENYNVQKMIKSDDNVIAESMPVPDGYSDSSYAENLPVPDVNAEVTVVNLD